MAQTAVRYIVFWKTVIKTFGSIYVNCFNALCFLAEGSTKLLKMHFFGQFKDHNSERKHRNRINDPIFYLLFLLQMFATFIFIFENGQISFSCGPLFGLFRSVKYLNFEQKLPSRTAYQIFLESRHREVTKNPYYVLSPKGSQKKVSYNGLIPVYRGVYIHYFKISPPTFCCPHFSENYLNP